MENQLAFCDDVLALINLVKMQYMCFQVLLGGGVWSGGEGVFSGHFES